MNVLLLVQANIYLSLISRMYL